MNDYCIAIQGENIQRELFKNGPVIAQMVPFTDFLAYKEGSYHKTQESFKFNGAHIVKIVGWSKSIEGSVEWIIENTWGESWGENGYAKMIGGRGDSQIDYYALGASVIPYTVYDYNSIQNMVNSMGDETEAAGEQYGQEDIEPINDEAEE